jgi:hypothetical protein
MSLPAMFIGLLTYLQNVYASAKKWQSPSHESGIFFHTALVKTV